MRERQPGPEWIAAATAFMLITLLAALFIPLKPCPECEDARAEFAEMGIDYDTIKTRPLCPLCGDDRKKVSILRHLEYERRH